MSDEKTLVERGTWAAGSLGLTELWDFVNRDEHASERMLRDIIAAVLIALVEIKEEAA